MTYHFDLVTAPDDYDYDATKRRYAADPNTNKEVLTVLHEGYPAEVLGNPITALLLLEDPGWPVPATCRRLVLLIAYLQTLDGWVRPSWIGTSYDEDTGQGSAYGLANDNGAGRGTGGYGVESLLL